MRTDAKSFILTHSRLSDICHGGHQGWYHVIGQSCKEAHFESQLEALGCSERQCALLEATQGGLPRARS